MRYTHNHPGTERSPRQHLMDRRAQRGPKTFQRADNRLRDDICERLMYRDDIDPSDVTVTVDGGEVTLDGTVPERWMRYVIDDIAESVLGVQEVENNIRVRRPNSEGNERAQLMGNIRNAD